MEVLSSTTAGEWLKLGAAQAPGNGEPAPDLGTQEAKRALSDVFRCANLVILAGLGTSLCVKPAREGGGVAPRMWDLWQAVKALHEQGLKDGRFKRDWEALLRLVRHDPKVEDIEAFLSRCRMGEAFLEGDELAEIKLIISAAESQIAELTDFLDYGHPLPSHVEFLRRAARRSNRKSRTKIFTTNYDRCFEEAGRQGRYVVIDGFSYTAPPTFDAVHFTYDIVRRAREGDAQDFIANVFHLYKLHGSVDWTRDERTGEIRKDEEADPPLLIYPRNSKYELAFEQPYLEMISAFQTAIREPNTGVLIVGFGFRDNHLAEPIMSAVRSNLSLKMAVVGPYLAPFSKDGKPDVGEASSNPHLAKLKELAAVGDARISLLNCDFEQMVSMVPDIDAESDLERHTERMRNLGQGR